MCKCCCGFYPVCVPPSLFSSYLAAEELPLLVDWQCNSGGDEGRPVQSVRCKNCMTEIRETQREREQVQNENIKNIFSTTCEVVCFTCRFGKIKSIKMLYERFCAFVNFENASMAASAMEMLNVSCSIM